MMKKLLHIGQMILMALVVIGLYAFTNHRNKGREVVGIVMEFTPNENVYTNINAVNKLLIQKMGAPLKLPKEKVALSTIEAWLKEDPMLLNANVYMTVDGTLRALLTQRTPEARIVSDSVFYLDKQGNPMPLSEFHSARVPLITGKLSKKSLEDSHKIVAYAAQDDFLIKNMVGIHVPSPGHYVLQSRMDDFDILLGDSQDLEEKINKLKAFYNKAQKDQSLQRYSLVDLRFKNQVVATKKQ
ncbi:MAG: Uncharacterised protein [SAR116 cluster bacterium]|nr:MAG: Uncharacterised protein [SAR116 cluster bacterium]